MNTGFAGIAGVGGDYGWGVEAKHVHLLYCTHCSNESIYLTIMSLLLTCSGTWIRIRIELAISWCG